MRTIDIIELPYRPSAEAYFVRFKPLGQRVWLDSCKPFSVYGEADILSAAPSELLVDPSPETLQAAVDKLADENNLDELAHYRIPFWGGVVGHFNYEYNHHEHGILAHGSGKTPSVFAVYDWALVQLHAKQKSFIVFLNSCSHMLRKQIKTLVDSPAPPAPNQFCVSNLGIDAPKSTYFDAFNQIANYILAGDTYQINYSQRFSGDFLGDADAAYLTLRKSLPSPFSAFLELGDDTIMSFSPERFIKVVDRFAISQPIKGTAARGKTVKEDQRLAQELECSEKNRAENLMIVDLLRNDFSKSCKAFSVRVPTLFQLESFANVHHLVSTIEGTLEDEVTVLEFFLRCFPGGSITGAPKKRAMEIIGELEQFPRNIYCGSVAYLSACGGFDSNIAIRTLLLSDEIGRASCRERVYAPV